MQCPECGYTPVYDGLPSCPQCGVDWPSDQGKLGIAPPLYTAEEPPTVAEWEESEHSWKFSSEERSLETTEPGRSEESRWGGFWRRLFAFSIDLMVLDILSILLFYICYVGYSVGLAAHGRALTREYLSFFVRFVLFAWLSLVAGYFILFHGMEGRTIGKWLFGLRVVGAGRAPITYRQAVIRWISFIPSVVSCLGILCILWNGEKRSWHDRLARTWVIRERGVSSKEL
jgi:uncharacterized RDD family membrane protein YckC